MESQSGQVGRRKVQRLWWLVLLAPVTVYGPATLLGTVAALPNTNRIESFDQYVETVLVHGSVYGAVAFLVGATASALIALGVLLLRSRIRPGPLPFRLVALIAGLCGLGTASLGVALIVYYWATG
jgi:hypothetical protein